MNTKIITFLIYVLVFLAANILSSKIALLKFKDISEVFGLGGVVIGYFGSKYFKKK